MDGWNTFSFPFGARHIFGGKPLVLGSVVDVQGLPGYIEKTPC